MLVASPGRRRLAAMRWGMIPMKRVNARGRPVMQTIVNARSESLFEKSAFEGLGRAVFPVDGWYEWTGAVRRKTRWRIARKDAAMLAFAAVYDVWRAPGGREASSFATVTCPPNAAVEAIHHRMPVVIASENVDIWLTGAPDEAAALCRSLPDGLLDIAECADPPV